MHVAIGPKAKKIESLTFEATQAAGGVEVCAVGKSFDLSGQALDGGFMDALQAETQPKSRLFAARRLGLIA